MKSPINKILTITASVLLVSCAKFEPIRVNKVETGNSSEITRSSVRVEGKVLEKGDKGIDQHGFYYSTEGDPTSGDHGKTDLGSGGPTGTFSETINGLQPSTTYYYRAYLKDGSGEVYGEVKSFTTMPASGPTLTTIEVTGVSQTSAVGGGTVTDDGGSTVTNRGVCWSTSEFPMVTDNRTNDGNGTGTFVSSISGLSCGTIYYVRAYATNATGTTYGNQVSIITEECTSDLPAITTTEVNMITEINAWAGGNVTSDGGSEVTERGICWSTRENPTTSDSKTSTGTGEGSYTSAITGLTCGTTYYVKAYAVNASGTSYGNQVQFTTPDCPTGTPVVTTLAISNILENSAQGGGDVTDDNGTAVTEKGVCWSTSQNPTIGDMKTSNGSGTGAFTSVISGLECSQTYYVRAYATNAHGTGYGMQEYFTTGDCPAAKATVTTNTVTGITETSATVGGNVTDDGGGTVQSRGVCWSTSQNPTINDQKTSDGSGTGMFTSDITGLECGKTYYVRAYATNSAGTSYGMQEFFTTTSCPVIATVTTNTVTNINETSAIGGGNVTDDGGTQVTVKGLCWNTSGNPTLADSNTSDGGDGIGSFTSAITALSCNTTYYVRAYATNSVGTAYGNVVTFITSACNNIPEVTTNTITDIGTISAKGGGNLVTDNGSWVTDKGVCWSTSPLPTISDSHTVDGSGPGSFTSNITGLSPYTTYYVRAYATNSSGTGYGGQVSFKTSTVVDYDGNIYRTVVIGSQTWMAENLRVTHYSDGTPIPYVNTDSDWANLGNAEAAYSYFGNAPSNATPYGALYTWPAIMKAQSSSNGNPSGVQGVCPSGWHVPSDVEWMQLEMYAGMSQTDAESFAEVRGSISGKLKETGYDHWQSPNLGATDEYGFSAIGSGWRSPAETLGQCYFLNKTAFFWTSTQSSSSQARGRYFHSDTRGISRWSDYKNSGMSVRCVKD